MKTNYPRISTEFDSTHHHKYVEAVERIMGHVLPPNFFEGEDVVERLEKQFPIVCWTPLKEPPFDLSFFLFCPHRANVFRFFYDRVSRGLIPDRRVNALLQFAIDFFIPELGSQ